MQKIVSIFSAVWEQNHENNRQTNRPARKWRNGDIDINIAYRQNCFQRCRIKL